MWKSAHSGSWLLHRDIVCAERRLRSKWTACENRPYRISSWWERERAVPLSLYHYLRQHPQIYMSPIKEPCYFASEIRVGNLSPCYRRHIKRMSRRLPEVFDDVNSGKPHGWLVSEWNDYLRLFQDVKGQSAVGEASAAYLWSTTAAMNIASRRPNARIVMILRDPAERAFSQYLHQLAVGLINCSFREHIRKCVRNDRNTIGALCIHCLKSVCTTIR